MWTPRPALRLVTDAAGLAIEGTPIPLPSDSNDAWKIGELVLRICWRATALAYIARQ